MSYEQDEIENYVMGSDLWNGAEDPVLRMGVNDHVFWPLVLERSRAYKNNLDCEENRNRVIALFVQRFPGEPLASSSVAEFIGKMISIASPLFVDPNAAPDEPVDSRPRDARGRVMSSRALLWREYERWVNDPETSMKGVNEKRRTDASFAEFYSTMGERQRLESKVGDAVENLNAPQAPTRKEVPEDVRLWATDYRTRSIAEIRMVMSPAMVGPIVAAENQRLFNLATEAGLI